MVRSGFAPWPRQKSKRQSRAIGSCTGTTCGPSSIARCPSDPCDRRALCRNDAGRQPTSVSRMCALGVRGTPNSGALRAAYQFRPDSRASTIQNMTPTVAATPDELRRLSNQPQILDRAGHSRSAAETAGPANGSANGGAVMFRGWGMVARAIPVATALPAPGPVALAAPAIWAIPVNPDGPRGSHGAIFPEANAALAPARFGQGGVSVAATGAGKAGTGFGPGSSGACSFNQSGGEAGAAGLPGLMIVDEYLP